MPRIYLVFILGLTMGLGGCSQVGGFFGAPSDGVVSGPPEGAIRPVPRPDGEAAVPLEGATTVEEFDTTTTEQRAAATAPVARPERELGTMVASLGDPTDPGFWAKTSLVGMVQEGRLVYPATNKSVLVELRPLEGAGSNGQVSLAALRILGAPLTGLPELVVFDRP